MLLCVYLWAFESLGREKKIVSPMPRLRSISVFVYACASVCFFSFRIVLVVPFGSFQQQYGSADSRIIRFIHWTLTVVSHSLDDNDDDNDRPLAHCHILFMRKIDCVIISSIMHAHSILLIVNFNIKYTWRLEVNYKVTEFTSLPFAVVTGSSRSSSSGGSTERQFQSQRRKRNCSKTNTEARRRDEEIRNL